MAKRILVIDNDSEYVEATELLLRASGFETLSALNGEEGFDKAVHEKPDCILLDVMMKHVSEGLDVAVKLRDDDRTKNIPVILVTGIRKPDFLASSYSPGETWPNLKGTLEKPVKPETLIPLITKAIGAG